MKMNKDNYFVYVTVECSNESLRVEGFVLNIYKFGHFLNFKSNFIKNYFSI